MAYTDEQLTRIFKKTDGRCRFCGKQLSFSNYGQSGRRGTWHVDHSRSKANGGTDHGNNLYAACVDCNMDKGARNGASYKRALREAGLHVPSRSLWTGRFR